MLGSLLLMLATSAGLLVVLAVACLLGAGQHTHRADVGDWTRRLRLGTAASVVCLGSLMTTSLLGARPLVSWSVAFVNAGAVLASWRLSHRWSARGVVVWSLLMTGTAGLLAWAAHGVVTRSDSGGAVAAGSVAWLALVLALARVSGYARGRVADRALRHPPDPRDESPTRPVPWPAAATAAVAGAVLLVPGVPWPGGRGAAPAAGHTRTDVATRPTPSSRPTTQATRSPSARPTGAAQGARGGSAPGGGAERPGSPSTSAAPASGGSEPVPPLAGGRQTKTPGWAKDKPHRPSDAHSPGSGPPGRR